MTGTHISRASWRLNAAALAVACIALFAALGGPSYAAGVVGLTKGSVKSKHIANGQVKSVDIANGGVKSIDLRDGDVGLGDLSAAAKASLADIPDGSVTTAKLADNAVNSAKVANDSLTSDDLGANSVRASEVAANSIDNDEIANGTLNGVDIGTSSGIETLDFPSIAAGDCHVLAPQVNPGAHVGDQVTVSPEADFNPNSVPLAFYGMSSTLADHIRVVACNVSAAPFDLGPVDFHYTVIDN
jgi:hypothetical protein